MRASSCAASTCSAPQTRWREKLDFERVHTGAPREDGAVGARSAARGFVTYIPRPIDTDQIALAPELERLVERLANHVHDLWAEARMAEGWTYGPRRDDVAKTHPGLVPYADLTETEKVYDRRTALGTLRAIVALGYRIEPPQRDR